MFGEKITLDRETFKVLAADTRVEIIKRLSEHKETLTDLAEGLDMSPSTIKEHLNKLVSAGLIEQIEGTTKWKYYKLTGKGERIIKPAETSVWILLAASGLVLAGSFKSLLGKLTNEPVLAMAGKEVPEAGLRAFSDLAETQATQIPYFELVLVVFFSILTGLLIGRILKN
ncbi:MAG: winged helix-turn-helix domain-containing protein [Methanobacteriota archaeon]